MRREDPRRGSDAARAAPPRSSPWRASCGRSSSPRVVQPHACLSMREAPRRTRGGPLSDVRRAQSSDTPGSSPSDAGMGGLMGGSSQPNARVPRGYVLRPLGTRGEQTELENSRSPRPARFPRLERSGLLSEWLHRVPVKADADGTERTRRAAAYPRPERLSSCWRCATPDRPTAALRPPRASLPVARWGRSSALSPSGSRGEKPGKSRESAPQALRFPRRRQGHSR